MDRIPEDDPRHDAPHAATPAPRRRVAVAVLVAVVGLLGGAVVGGAMAVAHAGTSPPATSAPMLGGQAGARSSTGGGTSPATSTGVTIDQLDGSPDTTGADDGRGDHDAASDGRSVSDGFELRGDGDPASGR